MGYICYMDIMGVLYFSICILNAGLEGHIGGHMKYIYIIIYIYIVYVYANVAQIETSTIIDAS